MAAMVQDDRGWCKLPHQHRMGLQIRPRMASEGAHEAAFCELPVLWLYLREEDVPGGGL